MFRKNVFLLGFTIIMVIGMLTYLFAWSFHNNMSGNQGMEQSPLSMEDKYPQGKLILEIVKSDIPKDEEVFQEILLDLSGVERAIYFSDNKQLVIFYDPEKICVEGIKTLLEEKGVTVNSLYF